MKNIFKKIIFCLAFIITFSVPLNAQQNSIALKISFTGDIMMHDAVKECALRNAQTDSQKLSDNRGFNYLFDKIKPHLMAADFTVGNMEFPVSPPFISKGVIFNCPLEVIPAMKWAGFSLVTNTNNHILDQGENGLLNTLQYLEQYQLEHIGVKKSSEQARTGYILNNKGIRVGIISYTSIVNYGFPKNQIGYYINDLYQEDIVKEDIENIKKRCDYLIMITHTGTEYTILPEMKDRLLLKKYLDYGVDLIVGHHPHVLQYIEKYKTSRGKDSFIFYSMGNFISNMKFVFDMPAGGDHYTSKESIILNLSLYREGGVIKEEFEILPIWTRNELISRNHIEYRDIQTVSIPDQITALTIQMEHANPAQKKSLGKDILYLKNRMEIIKRVLFYKEKFKEIRIRELVQD